MTTPPPGDQPLSRRELRERERAAAAAAAANPAATGPVATPSAGAAPVLPTPVPTGPPLQVPVETAPAAPVSSFAPEAPPAYMPPAAAVPEPTVGAAVDQPLTRRELRALREAEERAAQQSTPLQAADAPEEPPQVEPVEAVLPEAQQAEPVEAALPEAPQAEPVEAALPEPPRAEAVEAALPEVSRVEPVETPVPDAPALSPYEEWQRRMGLRAAEQAETGTRTVEADGIVAAPVPSPPAGARPADEPPVDSGPMAPTWRPAPASTGPEPADPAAPTPPPGVPAEEAAAEPPAEHAVPLVEPALPAPPVDPWARQSEVDQAVDTGAVSIVSREFGSSSPGTNSLVIQQPAADAPMSSTGDILATGSIQLPPHFAQSGYSSPSYDTGEHDHLFDPGDTPLTNTDAQPVRAANAVSIHTESGGSLSLVPQRSNKGIVALIVIAGSMAVLVAGTLVVAIVTGQL